VSTEGTAVMPEDDIAELVKQMFPLTPRADHQGRGPVASDLQADGAARAHFGRSPGKNGEFSWEKTDKADALAKAGRNLAAPDAESSVIFLRRGNGRLAHAAGVALVAVLLNIPPRGALFDSDGAQEEYTVMKMSHLDGGPLPRPSRRFSRSGAARSPLLPAKQASSCPTSVWCGFSTAALSGHALLMCGLIVCALGLVFGMVIYSQIKNMPGAPRHARSFRADLRHLQDYLMTQVRSSCCCGCSSAR
jgi:hypothetical protein